MKKLFFVLSIVLLASCEKSFDKLLTDPSLASPGSADADLYLNNAQIGFAEFFSSYDAVGNINGASDFGAQVMRMEASLVGSTYQDAYTPENFDDLWRNAYAEVFKNLNAMMPVAEEQKKYMHMGIGKTLKAYALFTLVDFFGDVPYTEANLGSTNTNPAADPGRVVYDSALNLLSSAILDMEKQSAAEPTNDLYYGGDAEKWITLAKTLQLRAYLQTRLVDPTAKEKIKALLDENDLIDEEAEDFQFHYSTKSQTPDSRHPKFINNYGNVEGAQDYIGTQFMWMLLQEKNLVDPRTRFYLYRQSTDIQADVPNAANFQFTLPCFNRSRPAHYTASMPFCYLGDGFLGRDHMNNEGIPPDQLLRTTFGVYPSGGRFDDSDGEGIDANDGGKGAGILPVWISAFTEFAKAEAALTLATGDDARTALKEGIRKSFDKVFNFPATIGVEVPANRMPSTTAQNTYVSKVLSTYDAAAGTDGKLNVVMKEWYLASWGNGVDPYNFYRRTGKPDNLQPPALSANPGSFIRSFFYPAVYANLNNKATQKTGTGNKVFWDTNPDNFIK